MTVKLETFDAAKYFTDPIDQADLLDDAVGTGHAGYIANALGVIARAQGMAKLAEATGMQRTALYRALSENGNPTLETVLKVVDALGLEIHIQPKRELAAV